MDAKITCNENITFFSYGRNGVSEKFAWLQSVLYVYTGLSQLGPRCPQEVIMALNPPKWRDCGPRRGAAMKVYAFVLSAPPPSPPL